MAGGDGRALRVAPGDLVIRRRRLLRTVGTVLRLAGQDQDGATCVWVRWHHPTTRPNPSREPADDLELVDGAEGRGGERAREDGR